jgi:kinesin family protein 6/9
MVKSNIETFLRIKPSDNIISHMHSNSMAIEEIRELIDNRMNLNEMNYELNDNNRVLEITMPDEMRKGYINNLRKTYEFKFNGVFDKTSTQEDIFKKIGKKVIDNSLEGYNNTVFCYGQTGSGKTFTMCGSKLWKERGLIPRIILELFKQMKKVKNYSYEIFISYLEIYNENAYDLLDRHHSEMDIEKWRKITVYEDNMGNIIMKNLYMIKVENEQQALDLLMNGNYIRHVSSTPNNLASSRSHAIFSCVLEGKELNSEVMRVSKINLVDLAGSERMKSNQYDTNTANETKYINLSLSFLEQVIIALNEKSNGQRTHIPYRNSLMTTILKDSLGGNCKTLLIANVSSEIDNLEETFSTMRFAMRCGMVENEIKINEHVDLNILVSKLHSENEELRK